jgi:hypothetical protein
MNRGCAINLAPSLVAISAPIFSPISANFLDLFLRELCFQLSRRREPAWADSSAVEAEQDTLPDSENPDLSIRDYHFANTTARYCLVQLTDRSVGHFKEQPRAALRPDEC